MPLNLRPARLRYCEHGVIKIDNSATELPLHGIAIGRRNYLFGGAGSGRERAPPSTRWSARQAEPGRPRSLIGSCADADRRPFRQPRLRATVLEFSSTWHAYLSSTPRLCSAMSSSIKATPCSKRSGSMLMVFTWCDLAVNSAAAILRLYKGKGCDSKVTGPCRSH
jgi:hypothetical protein